METFLWRQSHFSMNGEFLELFQAAVMSPLSYVYCMYKKHRLCIYLSFWICFFHVYILKDKMSLNSILSAEAIENAVKDCQGLLNLSITILTHTASISYLSGEHILNWTVYLKLTGVSPFISVLVGTHVCWFKEIKNRK